ncbi:MAG: hypothetical protein JNL23_10240 [Chitinophagaceae bacterium]|nr:hypothetical protein [Chitinophagaceae bacterium]
MAKKDIIQELNELNSSLSQPIPEVVYTVPEGYFDGFATQVLNRIKAINASNASEELSYLSPMLSELSKKLPYTAPQGYFDGLADSVLNNKNVPEDFQSVDEELESLSPLLSGIGKTVPFSVPQGYFENFQVDVAPAGKQQAKVIPMHTGGGSRKWLRYAAAAVVIGVITLSGVLFFRGNKPASTTTPYEIVKKEVKEISTNDINKFIETTDEENAQDQATTASIQSNEIKELMKDISEKDIQKFLNETEMSDENSDDLFLN